MFKPRQNNRNILALQRLETKQKVLFNVSFSFSFLFKIYRKETYIVNKQFKNMSRQ